MGDRRITPGKKTLAIAAAVLLPIFAILPVRALITNGSMLDGGFEIDGNLQKDAGAFDWANAGGSSGPTTCSALAAGTFASVGGPLQLSCARDTATGQSDNSLSGHEQDTSIQVVCGSIPNGKSDLANFYVASQSTTVSGSTRPHSFLYLGWTINSTGGSADMDFEFNQLTQPSVLQDGTAGHACASGSGDTANVGATRSAGDLLVEYQFASGGNAVTVKLAQWVTSGTCATSATAPCWGPETDLTAAGFASAAINDATTPDSFGGSNCPAPNTPPHAQQTGCVTNALSGGTLGPQQFGEAAIDLTNAIPSSGNSCTTFGSAYLKSRSSAVFTDAVKDYIAPIPVDITNCVTPTVTTSLSTNTANPGTSVTDSATITNFLGTSLGGTVAFNVYSGTGSSACAGTPVETLPAGANATTGASGATLTTSGSSASTASVTITNGTTLAAGHYEIQAVYSGDGSANLPSHSVCGSEPLQIRAQPVLTTSLSASSAALGTPVSDTAILSGFLGTNPPGGTVSFTVYNGTDNTACTTANKVETLPTSGGDSLSAGSGANAGKAVATQQLTTGTGTAPTLPPGSYEVQASYTGDGGNNLGATSTCGSEPLSINKVQPTITTSASPTTAFTVGTSTAISDTATFGNLISGIAPTGNVTFELFSDGTCTTPAIYALADAAGPGPVMGSAGITGAGPYTATFSTTWTPTLSPTSNPTYTWGISWPGDSNYSAVPGGTTMQCGGANETLTVQKASPTLSTKIQLNDIATLGGGFNVQAGDTITFKLFSGGTCSGNPVAEFDNVVISGGSASTIGLTPNLGTNVVSTAGTYDWQVTFSGDGFNNPFTSGCTTANHETATISYAGQ